MKKRRDPKGSAARLDEKVGAVIVPHPLSAEQQDRELWRTMVETWRSEADWQLLYAHRAAYIARVV